MAAPWSDLHVKQWLTKKKVVQSACGKQVEVWELAHKPDDAALSEWARHFRNHYCLDSLIDSLRGKQDKKTYLIENKLPSTTGRGPSIRAGDFGEILIADYLEWALNHWVPRVRWSGKVRRDESPKGSDVIGFKCSDVSKPSPDDVLTIIESKTKFSKKKDNRLQDAINDSVKEERRLAESLNHVKQRLFELGQKDEMGRVERFQNPVDVPFASWYGAAALYSDDFFEEAEVSACDSTSIPCKKGGTIKHPHQDKLFMVVITGSDMMSLVNELYRRAADEA